MGRVACKVAGLTSSEPSLQKQDVSAKWALTFLSLPISFCMKEVIKERHKTIELPVEHSAVVFIDN